MKAMIFAAGLGTRLKPLTDTLPKALVPVCSQPLIYYVCRKLFKAGIDEAVVNIHYFADKIEQWIESQPWIVTSKEDKHPIYAVVADSLDFVDVGKIDALKPAEEFAIKQGITEL